METMRRLPFLALIASALLTGCTAKAPRSAAPVPLARGAAACKLYPAACERLCASCKDPSACLESGGECAADFFQDTVDGGIDIWVPGCHHQYGDAVCTPPGAFLNGDLCVESNPKLLMEWTNPICHPAQADIDIYDCDAECLRAGRGNGRCTPDPTACSGNGSARCTCDHPTPPTP